MSDTETRPTDSTVAATRLWALLVGIDDYLAPGVNDLRGCVADVEAMRAFLVGQMGVPERQVRLLRNAEATRQGILDAFETFLIDNAEVAQGSQLLFHYSGHGSQMVSTSPNEPDGYDETIVPQDSRQGDVYDIPDKTLGALLDRLAAAKGDQITVILDSCHSGSGTRAIRGSDAPRARWVPADGRTPPAALDAALRSGPAVRQIGPSGWSVAAANSVLLAGCRDEQLSNEYASPEGGWHGALTYFTLEYLRNLPPGSTYADLHRTVAAKVTAVYPDQTPLCEGRRERAVFGGAIVERDPFIDVAGVEGDAIVLGGGLIYGLQPGTTLTVYPADTLRRDALPNPIATLEVAQADATTARAVVQGVPVRPVAPQDRCLIAGRSYAGMQQRVGLDTVDAEADGTLSAAAAAELRRLVAASPFLLVADGTLPPQLIVEARAAALTILSPDCTCLVNPTRLADQPSAAAAVAKVVRELESIARFRALEGLDNVEAGSGLHGKVRLSLRRYRPGVPVDQLPAVAPDAGGDVTLPFAPDPNQRAENQYIVEVWNHGSAAVFPVLFYLNPDFGITRLYPNQGQTDKLPGAPDADHPTCLRVGVPGSGEPAMEIYLPDMPRWESSHDRLKLLATTQAVADGLAGLAQAGLDVPVTRGAGVPGSKDPGTSPLAQLVNAVTSGGGTRQLRPNQTAPNADWAAADLAFTIVRQGTARDLPPGVEVVDLGMGLKLRKPAGVAGKITVRTQGSGTRDADGLAVKPPPALAALPRLFQPVTAPGTRSVGEAGLVLSLDLDDAARAGVSGATPLVFDVSAVVDDDTLDVLPIVFDGEDYLLAGYGDMAAGTVRLTHLPAPVAGDAPAGDLRQPATKDLKRLLTLFLYKQLGRRAEGLGLRYAVRTPDGQVAYSAVDRTRLKPGERVAVFVHGFSADTYWMAQNMPGFIAQAGRRYDHILTFDYESFGTGVADNGGLLADQLRDRAGLGPNDGLTVDVYAHSMGCLVSRCMIELKGGDAFIDGLVIGGPPNHGTTLATLGRGALFMLTAALNSVQGVPPIGALNWTLKQVYEQTAGWADIGVDAPITRQLNALPQPAGVAYLVMAGDNSANPASKGRMDRLARKVLDKGLDEVFGEQNDLVIGLSSTRGLRGGDAGIPVAGVTVVQVPCDHFGYYSIAEAQAAIRTWPRPA